MRISKESMVSEMTPTERKAAIRARLETMKRLSPFAITDDVAWLLARLERAEKLLRECKSCTDIQDTEFEDVLNAFLEGRDDE